MAFFRIELRWRFDLEGHATFSEENTQTFYEKSIDLIESVKDAVYKAGLIFKVPIPLLWEGMWTQVKSYFVVSSKYFSTIVFGQNAYTSKYFGATYSMKKDDRFGPKFVTKFIKVYGLVER